MTAGETARATAGNAVFLIPGLLGFESFAGFSYFSDRVAAALRAGLEGALGGAVPVIPVPIPPTASLQQRQAQLLKTLSSRIVDLGAHVSLPNIHLVGHSTGGVDANLLTRDRPIGAGCWADITSDAPQILAAIRSVVTLASPHQGACITRDPIAQFLGSHGRRGKAAAAALLFEIAQGALVDPDARDLVTGAAFDLGSVGRFLKEALLRGELIDDLQPNRAHGPGVYRRDVVRKSFVAIASCPRPGVGSVGRPDALFRDLNLRASGQLSGCSEEGSDVAASLERLRQALADPAGPPIIGHPGAALPSRLDAGHNDGIVNSVRQLFDPADAGELAAIVIGDHFDVIGHYDRRFWRIDRRGREQAVLINAGLLHSGSAFRDEEFFQLYRSIAACIVDAARLGSSASVTPLQREAQAAQ